MSLAWLSPSVFWGLVLMAAPIAIHLLARHQARTVPFPSLRFLERTHLAALRRRRIEDVLLLICRIAIIALAVAALAGPVLRTSARTAGMAARVSRAIVLLSDIPADRIEPVANGAFKTRQFRRTVLVDALDDAVRWLDEQPASSREIVVVGRMRRGEVTHADLVTVPAAIGVRFVTESAPATTDVVIPVLAARNGSLVRLDRVAHLTSDATTASDGEMRHVRSDLVRVVAGDQILADAALATALEAGVPWADFDTPVVVRWGDLPVPASTGAGRIVSMPVPASAAVAADELRRTLQAASPPALVDSVSIDPQQLTEWTRPAGAPSPQAPMTDEGDRRALWAAVLLLLGLEWWLRRVRAAAQPIEEARVA